ncbi:hypothetical protein [Kitasatospora indigofera]|uniref:hypothetical protein n=1 Tax=Kitasatospora indigofera TaxID=67307 RepID=UPI0036C12C72
MTDPSSTPAWLEAVHDADDALGKLNREAEEIADRRAHAILRGVEASGRGGRDAVARRLFVRVGAVDKALARAKASNARPSFLPYDLLERLLELELAEVRPLTAEQWQAVGFLVRSRIIDQMWLHTPGELLAGEIEEATSDDGDLAGVDGAPLAAAARSWTRTQAIAVLEALREGDTTALPTTGQER